MPNQQSDPMGSPSQATRPLVSVVMPAYNAARWIAQSIESVLAQSYGSWELIVVDDGSTDATPAVVSNYSEYVHYVRQQNQGAPAARNRGIREARGDYFLFLDADDLLTPNALEVLTAFLETHPEIDVAYGDGFLIDENGTPFQSLHDYRIRVSESYLEQFVISAYIGYLGVILFRRSALTHLDGPFDEELFAVEDWDLLIRVAAAGCKFANVPEVIGYYRIHGSNTSSPYSPAAQRRQKALIQARLKVMRSDFFNGLSEPIRYQFFYSLLMNYLKGQFAEQDQVIKSPEFARLPRRARARLLYYLGIANITLDNQIAKGRARLKSAVMMTPFSIKHLVMYCLALCAPGAVRQLIALRRSWRGRRSRGQSSVATVPFRPST